MAFGVGPLTAFIVVNYTGDVDTRWAYRTVFCAQYGFAAVSTVLVPFMPEYVILHNSTSASPGLSENQWLTLQQIPVVVGLRRPR